VNDLADRLRRWRHDLHQLPETGLAEHRTSDYLAGELSAIGLDVTRGIGGTGLVATVLAIGVAYYVNLARTALPLAAAR
jgi:metal-dependent amidase/aminoacylase/carboxypeptidase family protein